MRRLKINLWLGFELAVTNIPVILINIATPLSLYNNQQNSTTDIDYIEVFSP